MSPLMSVYDQMPDGFPRVSGDEPCLERLTMFSSWFSPRERG